MLRWHPAAGEGALPPHRVATHFLDAHFEPGLLRGDWRDITTPIFDEIFEYQGFAPDTIGLVYVMLGRLLFPVKAYDQWEVVPFFKGVAGCGKSTVAAIVESWFPRKFVSTISSNMEDKFGLEGLLGSFVCLCLEVTSRFPLDRGVWQSMVTGEAVNVPRKNMAAVQEDWSVPMAMFGNEAPSYEDKAGSVHRRTVAFAMQRSVADAKVDPTMQKRLRQDPAPLLVKCARAYLELASQHPTDSFWKLASPQMLKWKNDLLQEVDALSAYLSSEIFAKDASGFIAEDDLRDDYKLWLQHQGGSFNRRDWNRDHLSTVYQRNGLEVRDELREWPRDSGKQRHGRFVHGLRRVDEDNAPGGAIGAL
jgi:phage/plasmid-associated DNA primase